MFRQRINIGSDFFLFITELIALVCLRPLHLQEKTRKKSEKLTIIWNKFFACQNFDIFHRIFFVRMFCQIYEKRAFFEQISTVSFKFSLEILNSYTYLEISSCSIISILWVQLYEKRKIENCSNSYPYCLVFKKQRFLRLVHNNCKFIYIFWKFDVFYIWLKKLSSVFFW